jgi:hypothetical protein
MELPTEKSAPSVGPDVFLRGAVALRHQAPAREPTNERTEHEPGLRCKGDIGGQTDDNAEREAEDGSKTDGGSDAHMRECMVATHAAHALVERRRSAAPPPASRAESRCPWSLLRIAS